MKITETILCKYNHNNHTLFLTFNLIFVSSAELSTVNQFFCLILIEKELYTMSRPLVKSVFGNISPINLGEDFMIIEYANLKEIEGEDVRSESCIIFYCISGSLCLIVGSEKITIKSGYHATSNFVHKYPIFCGQNPPITHFVHKNPRFCGQN